MADSTSNGNNSGQPQGLIKMLPDWHPIAKAYKLSQNAAANGPKPPSKTYRGGCHCGAINFDVTLSPPLEETEGVDEIHTVVNCSCSACRRFGYLLVYPSRDNVVFHNKGGGQKRCATYQFNQKLQEHLFCKLCGASVMVDFQNRFAPDWYGYGVSVRSLYDVDVDNLKLLKVDGEKGVHPAMDLSGKTYVESDTEE